MVRLRKRSLPLLFVASIIAAAIILPIGYLGIRAAGIGEEFLNFLVSSRTLEVFLNTALLAFLVTLASALIAVPAAFITVKTDIPAKRFWTLAIALPLAIPSFVGSFALIAAFAPRGSLLQNMLAPLGVETLPSIYGWPGTLLALTLFTYPFIFLTTRASLLSMDPSLEEVGRTLGYRERAIFLKVNLPQMYPSIASGGLLVAFYTLSDFGTPSLMRFDTVTRVIYSQYQFAFDRSGAAVLSLLLVAVAIFVLILEYRARNKASYYATGLGSKRPMSIIRLGHWRGPALILCGSIVSLALVIPIGVMFYWLFQGPLTGELLKSIPELAFNSVYVSALATLIIVPVALPFAILAVRFPSKLSHILEKITYLGFAMPGIVVALALVSFGAAYGQVIYQTTGMLIFAYMILFVPLAVGSIRSSLLQISPRLEESANSLGMSSTKVLTSVVFPLARAGFLAGSAMVFLSAMKELPATLLLSPLGFKTLATQVWSDTDSAFFAEAAAPALILVAVSAFFIFVILSQEKIWFREP